LFRAFLSGDVRQWKSLALNSNNLVASDLKSLIPLFQLMENLTSISLNGNCDDSMPGIAKVLTELLTLSQVENLSLRGTKDHKLKNE
jgi:hypothetical protein